MDASSPSALPAATARKAGVLYLIILLCGLWSELGVRAGLIDPQDAEATAEAILASEGAFRASLAADTVMAVSDVGVAVLLFALFRPYGFVPALAAAAYRLVQTAIIAGSLLFQTAALLVLKAAPRPTEGGADGVAETAGLLLAAHAHGYDLGLVFFGASCLLTALLLLRLPHAPRILALMVGAAGAVYVTGSALRFLTPEIWPSFAPAYAVPLLAELSFALWLLAGGGLFRQRRMRPE